MSQIQFSKKQYVNIFDTNEIIRAGSFQALADFEIETVAQMVYFSAITPTTQKIRCILYSDSTYATAVYMSSWYTFADLGALGPYGRWFIPISFNKENISNLLTYYIAFEIGNYTKSTGYIALEYDFIDPIYTNELVLTSSLFKYLVFGNVKPV